MVRRILEQQPPGGAAPPDWCYVYNFAKPHRPRALQLPRRAARRSSRDDMERLVEDLRAGIPAAFETDEYRARLKEIENEFKERQEQALGAVGEHARRDGIALLRTPAGFGFAPVKDDEVMGPEEFQKLPEAEQERMQKAIAALQEELEARDPRAAEVAPRGAAQAARAEPPGDAAPRSTA